MSQAGATLNGHVVNGHREPGIIDRVHDIEERHRKEDEIAAARLKLGGRILWALWGLVVAIIAAIGEDLAMSWFGPLGR